MARAVIAYDKDLPEIPGRRPWEKPTSYLIKADVAATGWREAIETLVWLVEIAGARDAQKLIQAHATIFETDGSTMSSWNRS